MLVLKKKKNYCLNWITRRNDFYTDLILPYIFSITIFHTLNLHCALEIMISILSHKIKKYIDINVNNPGCILTYETNYLNFHQINKMGWCRSYSYIRVTVAQMSSFHSLPTEFFQAGSADSDAGGECCAGSDCIQQG